jgi:hypothetical protein
MIWFHESEKWETIFELKNKKYSISNYGRIASHKNDIQSGYLLKYSLLKGYAVVSVRLEKNQNPKTIYIHKLVAEKFLKKENESQNFVIHKDFNKLNNRSDNLKWATQKEVALHQKDNPRVKAGHIKTNLANKTKKKGGKLSVVDVKKLKNILKTRKNITIKKLAEDFNISEMQVYRIKNGSSWQHI